MLEVTKPFDKYNHFFKIANNVPTDDINLAFFNSTNLSPKENLIINNNYDLKIYENKEQLVFSDEDYILKDIKTLDKSINSEYFFITDIFYGDEPLYYVYKLSYPIYAESTVLQGEYTGKHIHLEDIYGNIDIPSNLHYIVYFKRPKRIMDSYSIDSSKYVLNQLYEVYIYTNFIIKDGYRIKAKYSAYKDGEISEYDEEINPTPIYRKVNDVLTTIKQVNTYHLKKDYENLYSSIISIGSIKDDTRNPQEIRVKIIVTFSDGETKDLYIPNDIDTLKLYHYKSLLDSEKEEMCVNKRQQLTLLPISSYFEKQDIIKVEPIIDSIDRGKQMVKFYFSSDGSSPLFATTELEQNKIEGYTCKKYLCKNEKILTCYSILKKDSEEISIEFPREYKPEQSWFLRIKNGRYIKVDGENSYHYFLPEYYNQNFLNNTYPYKEVKSETPIILSNHSLKLKYYPIYSNLKILDKDINKELTITNIIYNDGIVFVEESLSEYSNLECSYIYEEQYLIYTGYKNNYLDCNPNKHHHLDLETSTFSLLDKNIYFYLSPAIEKNSYGITYHNNVLFHSFEEYSKEQIESQHLILLGVVRVRPNSSFNSLILKDTRSRGGGLTTLISDELRKLIEPESDWYWDIGYWDGEAIHDNGVIVVKLDKNLLIENGGKFTKEQIESAVYKHVALGTYVIIDFVSTYQNLNVNRI